MSRKVSKLLSLVLRHQPETLGITLDEGGWVSVGVLLQALERHGTQLSVDELRRIVAESDKQRFALSADGWRIRANQGHSVSVDLGLDPRVPPELLFHGTATRNLDSIRQQGLLRGARHHVHLTADCDTAVRVGQRYGAPVCSRSTLLRCTLRESFSSAPRTRSG